MSFILSIAAAAAFADLNALDRRVAEFTGVPAGNEGGAMLPLDRRLRLKPCNSPESLSWRDGRHDSVVVECPDFGGWRLFVPIRAGSGGLSATPAINRGDAVTIAVQGDDFSVSESGEALESGLSGAWIRVRGIDAKAQVMRARVVRPGLVSVDLP
jgi:flagella basal body P-ring formation protein FlgA